MTNGRRPIIEMLYLDPCYELNVGDLEGPCLITAVGYLCEDDRFPHHVSIAQEFSDLGPVGITHVPENAVIHREEIR